MLKRKLEQKTNKNKIFRTGCFVLVDIMTVILAALVPMMFRFGIFSLNLNYLRLELMQLPYDIVIFVAVNSFLKLYNRVWSFASLPEMKDCILSATITEVLYVAYKMMFNFSMPRSYYPINWMVLCMMLCSTRVAIRVYRRASIRHNNKEEKVKVMIVGAGSAASSLINELIYGEGNYKPVCAIDDNLAKRNSLIRGVPVVGNRNAIEGATIKYGVEEIIIAIPSATPAEMRELIEECKKTNCKIRRLPAIAATVTGSLTSSLRDINYEDLLARDTVVIKNPELSDFIKGKTILITGGGGSIGSEICRQIAANKPDKFVILDIYENTTYELERELNTYYPEANFETVIASVRDYDRMEAIFDEYKPDIVFHAAAHKHVPLMEYSPNEAIKNNCLGTLNLVKLSNEYGVNRFVLISTDKAVNPTSVMGATKRICEMIIQEWDKKSDTEFVAVRFGNVLGSNGSVIPLFLKQIEQGGPITLTHRKITRFFMTIPEAVSLVLTAALMAKGGEIFVLDMGEPVLIYDLACNLIRMKGLEPEKDIKIDVVGLRPGEKLYEELLMDEEGIQDTQNSRIKIGKPLNIEGDFDQKLQELISEAFTNSSDIKNTIKLICPTYQVRGK